MPMVGAPNIHHVEHILLCGTASCSWGLSGYDPTLHVICSPVSSLLTSPLRLSSFIRPPVSGHLRDPMKSGPTSHIRLLVKVIICTAASQYCPVITRCLLLVPAACQCQHVWKCCLPLHLLLVLVLHCHLHSLSVSCCCRGPVEGSAQVPTSPRRTTPREPSCISALVSVLLSLPHCTLSSTEPVKARSS